MAATRLYYWPSMRKQIKNYVRNCLICASTKRGGALQPTAPLRPHPPVRPWQTISLDIMGPYPQTRRRNRFLVVATDLFSRWVEAKPVPRARTQEVLQFFEEVCQRWGYPENTITDNGKPFISRDWECFHETHNIAIYTSPIYHHRSNPVERRNQELKKLLRIYLQNKQENQWDEVIGNVLFTLRNRTNASTGVTPSEALLGAQLARPGEWRHPQVRQRVWNQEFDREERIQKMQARQIEYARNVFPEPRVAPKHFNVGDQVLVRNFSGTQTVFSAPWSGPHSVVSIQGENVYEVDRNGAQALVHVDDLRPVPSVPLEHIPEQDPFIQAPFEGILQPPTLEENLQDHLAEEKEPQPEPREPQQGPSSRAPDPAEFIGPPRTNTVQVVSQASRRGHSISDVQQGTIPASGRGNSISNVRPEIGPALGEVLPSTTFIVRPFQPLGEAISYPTFVHGPLQPLGEAVPSSTFIEGPFQPLEEAIPTTTSVGIVPAIPPQCPSRNHSNY